MASTTDEQSGEKRQDDATGLFREEALRHHLQPVEEGDVLRLSPRWASWAYWLLAAVVVTGILYLILGSAREFATGPAVLRLEGREDLVARASGTVAVVEVHPGQAVEAGDVLVRFHAEPERAELGRMQQEFDQQLVERLRDPGNDAARQALTPLRASLDLARARVEERLIRAPRDGVVGDVRIHAGQPMGTGEVVVSLVPPDQRFSVVALLPGHHRPLLREGMPLRLEMTGYTRAYEWARIDEVGDQVIGPAEARRFLGPEVADMVAIAGPVVVVRSEMSSSTFRAWGATHTFHDGMVATAETPVRKERILFLLFPWLKPSLGDGGG